MTENTLLSRSLLPLALSALCLLGCHDSSTSPTNFWGPRRSAVAESRRGKPRGKYVDVKLALARSMEKQGRTDRALQLYLDVVDDGYPRGDAYHRLAVLHDKRGDHVASGEFYQEALRRDPDNAEIHCDQGYSFYLQERWVEAEAALRRAVALRGELTRAHNNLGLLLGRTGHPNESLLEFVRAGCSEAEARANLGFVLTLDQHWSGAEEQFELALAADPECRRAQEGLSALRAVNSQPSGSGWAMAGDSPDGEDAQADRRVSLPRDGGWQ